MNKVRAKFECSYMQTLPDGETKMNFYAVVDGSYENEQFFKYTPNGVLEMIVRSEVAGNFEVGREYYLDFVLAED